MQPIQKRVVLIAAVVFSLTAILGALYTFYIKKNVSPFTGPKNQKKIPLFNPLKSLPPPKVPTHSFFSQDFDLEKSGFQGAETRYRGNKIHSFPVRIDWNIKALGILDAKASHPLTFLGLKRDYNEFRDADPNGNQKKSGSRYDLKERLAEINLKTPSDVNFATNWIKNKVHWLRNNRKEGITPNLENHPKIIHDLISDVFQKLFRKHNQIKIEDFSHGSHLQIQGHGGAALFVYGDTLNLAESGESKCILIKGKNNSTFPAQPLFSTTSVPNVDDSIPDKIDPLVPTISTYSLKDLKGCYLVLASSKLFETITPDEIKKAVELMDAQDLSPGEMSQNLVYNAVNNGSNDFLNVAVVKL